MNNKTAPIIYIHKGTSPFIKPSIEQTRKSNPNAPIYFLGDYENRVYLDFFKSRNIKFYLIENYSKSANRFREVYRHSGSNPYEYELFCFLRWFIIRDFLADFSGIDKFIYLDTDAILYIDMNIVFSSMRYEMSVCDVCGPQFLFFKTISALNSYCNYITDSFVSDAGYKVLSDYVAELNDPGIPHISDMVTLGGFSRIQPLHNLSNIDRGDYFFCENITTSQGLRMATFGKKITKIDDTRYFIKIDGGIVRAGGVHLQGGSKVLWPFYVDLSVNYANFNFYSFLDIVIYAFKALLRDTIWHRLYKYSKLTIKFNV